MLFFPGRTEIPKTLVFAKDDSHAEDIVHIIREEFGKGNDFCKKITYRTAGDKSEDLIASFRNSYNPRIAVTVDMISTGTDIKPPDILFYIWQYFSSTSGLKIMKTLQMHADERRFVNLSIRRFSGTRTGVIESPQRTQRAQSTVTIIFVSFAFFVVRGISYLTGLLGLAVKKPQINAGERRSQQQQSLCPLRLYVISVLI